MSVLRAMLHEDQKKAILAKDKDTQRAINIIFSELDRKSKFAEDPELIKEIKKLHTSYTESAAKYGGKIAEEAAVIIAVIEKYLPKQLTVDEMNNIILSVMSANDEVVTKAKSGDNAARGMLMKQISNLFAGRGDNKYANAHMIEILNGIK